MDTKTKVRNQFRLPMLIMVMGFPGSGKTFFSKVFSNRIGGIHINSDKVRKELYQQPAYDAKDKLTVYKTMFCTVCQILKKGEAVVVDATFSRQKYRTAYFDFVRKNYIRLYIIQIEASEQTIAQRLQKERPDSDADFAVYEKIKSEFEPLGRDHCVLKSDDLSMKEMIRQSLEFIGIRA